MPNALASETSPYLLQHAHNPVEWVAWSDAAFARARREDRLVFLSIGYSTCHWCHVMERESFENEAIAAVMNESFVCIKVDREERPDIDAVYMAFVQASTGQGGWPMSLWLTPQGEPVAGGTYFPPEDRYGRAGFPKLCGEIARLWREDRSRLENSGARIMTHLREQAAPEGVMQRLPGKKMYGDFLDRCEGMFDPEWGGWGGAPKFPRPAVGRALLQLAERFHGGDEAEACLQMVERTLKAMAAGGMHDQLGGGFHRYAVDRYWHVPHYEKMLYDQGQLALLYLEAWRACAEEKYRAVAEDIFRYVLTEMKDAGSAFHAAEDADSLLSEDAEEKKEGAYWTWTAEEIYARLSPETAALFCEAYGVTAEGNARPESDPHGELEGRNTLYQASSTEGLAERFEKTEEEIRVLLAAAKTVLLEARSARPKPHRDDKIVTAWNGLMIEALATGGRMLGLPELIDAAREALAFIKRELWEDGRLWRSARGRRGAAPGFPADHACLISALIAIYSADGNEAWLEWGEEIQADLDERYWSTDYAGYVMTPEIGGKELMTLREDYDGAEPAPNHVAAVNLLKLATLLDQPAYAKRAEALIRAGTRVAETQPFAVPALLAACDLFERGVVKVEAAGEVDAALLEIARRELPLRGVLRRSEGRGEVIVCEGESCHAPVRTIEEWKLLPFSEN